MSDLKVGLIGGSGLGQALGVSASGNRHEIDTPFGRPSDAIVETEWAGVPVFMLPRHGSGHTIMPSAVPFRANIFALKQLGCTHILASGAVGSLREEFQPRHLVIPDQLIDKTHKRSATFYEKAAVHVEFAEPFCPVLRRIVLEASKCPALGVQASGQAVELSGASPPESQTSNRHPSVSVHDGGCYICMEGPAFSTRAESLMHRLWGGDLIGMTAMPEAKLAREAEISYALIALVTDYDSWRQKPPTEHPEKSDPFVLLKEIMGNLEAATHNAIELMKRAVALLGQRRQEALDSPARQALKLAIWTDKSRIPRDQVERLRPLWGHYFDEAPSEPAHPAPSAPPVAGQEQTAPTGA